MWIGLKRGQALLYGHGRSWDCLLCSGKILENQSEEVTLFELHF